MAREIYTPASTLERFLLEDARVRLIIGPLGCVSGDTEFLTPTGWKQIDAWEDNDQALVLDETGKSWFETVEHVDQPAKDLLWFRTRSLSMQLSPDHTVYWFNRQRPDQLQRSAAVELVARADMMSLGYTCIPQIFSAPTRPGLGLAEPELRLAVALAADGATLPAGKVRITIKKPRKITRLTRLLTEAGVTVAPWRFKGGELGFAWDGAVRRHDDPWWWRANASELAVIVDEMVHWDGSTHPSGQLQFHTTLPGAADFIQYAAAATGRRATVSRYGTSHRDKYVVTLSMSGRRGSSLNQTVATVPAVNKRQYCLRTSSGIWLARHNGRIFWTGNSGKTTAMIMECLRRAAAQAPSPDGIRRTRCAIVRNTLKQLMSTVLPDVMSVLSSMGPIARFHVTTSCIRVRVGDIQSDWYLMPLDTVHDTRRLLSMQLTWAWLAEFREIAYEILYHLRGRCGRYPSVKHGGVRPSWYGVFGESNPFSIDSPWNLHLIEALPEKWKFFRQPGGRSPQAENVENLPVDYYTDLVSGADPGWVAVHVDAEIGESLEGKGVWRQTFDRGFHVAPHALTPMPELPLIFSFDFGRTPACLMGQLDPLGRIVVLGEWTSEDMALDNFLDRQLIPWLHMQRLWSRPKICTADPTGAIKAQASDLSCFGVLKARGFPVRPAETNDLQPRLSCVARRLLLRMGLLVSPVCRTLVRALAGEYRYRRKRNGELEDTPDKTHPISDIADCLQYLVMLVDGRGYQRSALSLKQARTKLGAPPMAAWT